MHKLPELTYDFGALEPHIDALTMEIHYGKHHNAYVTNLNNALEAAGGDWHRQDLIAILRTLDHLPEAQRTAVRNNGGGHYNHSFFWQIMSGKGGSSPSKRLEAAIQRDFGSFDAFKEKFSLTAATRFGSGWAWLSWNDNGLSVFSTPNQDNPIIEGSGVPILGLDVWEHAYYLTYRNRRPDYIKAWWNVVNWEEVSRRFESLAYRKDKDADIYAIEEARF